MRVTGDIINLSLLWTAIAGTAAAVIWMTTTFATAAEVEDIQLSIDYGQFYDRLDHYEQAVEEGRDELAEELKRQMERLRARICAKDPKWERCPQ